MPTDAQMLADYRERFRRGPVGVWTTSLGAGWDIGYGCQFEFKPDFTGRIFSYDTGDDEEPETEDFFTWKLVDDFVIETAPVETNSHDDDWGILRYGFQFATSKYGGEKNLVLYEIGYEPEGELGFWWSPNPVVLTDVCP